MALGRQPAQNYGSSMSSSRLQEGMSSVRDTASDAMQSASDTLASTKERITGNLNSMRDRASQVTDTAREQWQRARGGLDYLVHEQPLALGPIGLANGAMLGAAAPRTRQEERLMGEASRGLREKAQDTVKQAAEEHTPQPEHELQGQNPRPTAVGPDKLGAW